MARDETTVQKIEHLMAALGKAATGPGVVYFTGGATALLIGWRDTTVDVDMRLDPEAPGLFQAIAFLKDELCMNIELACPADFIPAVPGWQTHSRFIRTYGPIDFYHYDIRSQALSKIERGHERDLKDVKAMIHHGLIEPKDIPIAFEAIQSDLIRYPAIDADVFKEKVNDFMTAIQTESE